MDSAAQDNEAGTARDREERLKAEYELGTKAFRVVFDMRKALWPPDNTSEYWAKVWKLTKTAEEENPGNRLLVDLMVALYRYLEETVKITMNEE